MSDPNARLGPSSHLHGQVARFERSRGRVVGELVLPVIGAVLFIGAAVVLATVVGGMGILGGLIFGMFGVFMAASAIAAASRGLGTTAIEIGADGIWMPDVGRLGWTEIEDVRVETLMIPAAGPQRTDVRPSRRLGIVPTAARARSAGLAARFATGFAARFLGLSSRLSGRSGVDLAPLGINAYELGEARFDELVATVHAFRPVASIADEVVDPDGGLAGRLAELDPGVRIDVGP